MIKLTSWCGIFLLGVPLIFTGCNGGTNGGGGGGDDTSGTLKIAMMPKVVGIDYFNAVEQGAQEAAKEIGAELIWDGPVSADVSKQIEMLDTWIARGVDVIAVAPNDPNALSPTLEKARKRDIKVITYDADSSHESRNYFVNQATAQSIGYSLVDEMAEQIGGAGEVAIITGSMTADNQNQWIAHMNDRIVAKYPGMQVVTVKPSEEDQQLATQVTQDLIKAYPNLKGVFAITSVAFPGAALAVSQAGKSGQLAVVGLATPKAMAEYVNNGTVKTVILWNPMDLGYLTVQVAGKLGSGGTLSDTFQAGRLGDVVVSGTQVLLGEPMKFNKENIGQFNF
jgi:rhamnose transport system substrate-binding protein